jgi:2-amino-4-hydroxy-6-hydroxymethyldihydropteridine diphosphokinase
MPQTLISLGANLGDTRESMLAAGRLLVSAFGPELVKFSHLYKTPAIGGPSGQGDFLNAVTAIHSDQSVWQVWKTIQRMEQALGRQRQHRWEARRIDIDLLISGNQRIWTPWLKVPHPRMCMRLFALQPAAEVCPDWIDPVTQWSIDHLRRHWSQDRFRIRAIFNSNALFEQVSNRLEDFERVSFSLMVAKNPGDASRFVQPDDHLLVVCAATPEPESIHWEDHSRPWADWLGLTPNSSGPQGSGPRYLLPGNDPAWVAHELLAAAQAMTCPLQIDGVFPFSPST